MSINPKWVAYNNLNNEGGEGYNPHPKYIVTGLQQNANTYVDGTRRKIEISGNTYPHRDLFRKMG